MTLRTMLLVGVMVALAEIGPAGAQPNPPRARLTEDLRLDATVEDFPRVRWVYVGPRGQIVVPIVNDMNVRIYDSTGKRTAVVGRKGRGPGEFEEMFPVGWKADTMWVSDNSQRRVTYVGPDGKFLRTTLNETFDAGWTAAERERAQATMGGVPMATLSVSAIHSNGTIVGYANGIPRERGASPEARLVRVSPDKKQTTIATLPNSWDERWMMRVDGFGNLIPFAVQPQTAVSVTGDRVAHMWSTTTSRSGGTFTVTAIRATGDTMFVRTYPFAGVAIPSSARDSAITALGPRPGPAGRPAEGSPDMPLRFQAIAREKMPSIYAGVANLVLGLDNTVWVGLRRSSEGQTFLALNAKGDVIASIAIPANSRLHQASSTHVYLTETDSDGLVSVVRYRVTGISCGPAGCR